MTGDDNGNRIFSHSAANGTGGFRLSDLSRQLAITDSMAVGNFLERIPYAGLKNGTFRFQWYGEILQFSVEIGVKFPGGIAQKRRGRRPGRGYDACSETPWAEWGHRPVRRSRH